MSRTRKTSALVHLEGAENGSLLKPFYDWAKEWYAAAATEVAEQSGGKCGVLQTSILSSAAAALAWERYSMTLAAQSGNMGMARNALAFGDSARKSLAALPSLAAKSMGFVDPLAEPGDVEVVDAPSAKRIAKELKKTIAQSDKRMAHDPEYAEQRERDGELDEIVRDSFENSDDW